MMEDTLRKYFTSFTDQCGYILLLHAYHAYLNQKMCGCNNYTLLAEISILQAPPIVAERNRWTAFDFKQSLNAPDWPSDNWLTAQV